MTDEKKALDPEKVTALRNMTGIAEKREASLLRQLALEMATRITLTVASTSRPGEAGDLTLANADRFAKWLEDGQIPGANAS